MHSCRQCAREIPETFRFCPWCAAPQRLKLVEIFHAHPEIEADAGKSLRVSRYVGPEVQERHVRLSVWHADACAAKADAALSLSDAEAGRLAEFLLATNTTPRAPHRVQRLLWSIADALPRLSFPRRPADPGDDSPAASADHIALRPSETSDAPTVRVSASTPPVADDP